MSKVEDIGHGCLQESDSGTMFTRRPLRSWFDLGPDEQEIGLLSVVNLLRTAGWKVEPPDEDRWRLEDPDRYQDKAL